MKRYKILFYFIIFLCSIATIKAQNLSFKTNLLSDITTTMNLGAEFRLSHDWSLEFVSALNPWNFSDDKKIKHILIQPSVRKWFCEFRNGWFVGIHAHWSHFNVAGVKLPFGVFPSLEKSRYQGDLYGGGMSFGYSWLLSKSIDIETELGLGYAHVNYDKYPCRHCSMRSKSGHFNYFGPTRFAVNVVYSF